MSKNIFNSIQQKRPGKNVFDLSHDVKMSLRMGELVPTMVLNCVPGDRFNIGCDTLLRFAPLVAPIMHRLDMTMHYFFVPNRLLWSNWEKFITRTPSIPVMPFITIDETTSSDFTNYMGIPPCPVGGVPENVSAFPFAAYQLIWNEYYRDQNLQASIVDPQEYMLANGDNTANPELFTQRMRCWEHDYFTSALPFAQKGADVDIPLGDIQLDSTWTLASGKLPTFRADAAAGGGVIADGDLKMVAGGIESSGQVGDDAAYDPDGTLIVESTTINDLRRAYRLQEWAEKAARGGSRLKEMIWSFFGERTSDARLQRPEYITGVKSPVVISEVLQTSSTDVTSPQANMSGHAVSVQQGKYGSYKVEEHGYIIGIMSVLPKTAYQQGIPRHYSINDPVDFYWPPFANLGEQEVKVKEVFAYDASSQDVFGYVPRYAEYKFMNSRVAGDFQTSLAFWHMGRIFSSPPVLNEQFVESSPRTDVFAVSASQQLYAHILHKIRAVRPMPKYGTPMT